MLHLTSCSTGHWCHSVSTDNYATYNLLKDDRAAGHLVFPPTTLAQKEVILSNVENALAIWANYDSKIATYGPAADPFPTIKRLRENIEKITDEELQLGITDAFIMARDRHTRWTNIAPYGCFHATTGVTFTFIEGDPDITKKPTRAALEYLTTIYGKINRLPSDDSINFQFKSRANPEIIYTVNVPYVSGRNEDCWELGSKLYKSLPSITLPGAPATNPPVSAEQPGHSHGSDTAHPSPGGHQTDSPEDPEREADIDQISSSRQKPAVSMNPTDVTEVTWGIYQPESTNMGIIKLDSFDPEDVGTNSLAIEKAIMIVRSLLVNELKDTKSVIYELRGNPGGSAKFADSMVQLFKPDFEPFGDRYLMNDLTHEHLC
ncbi:hypothetical protein BASA50_001007 [Batrachochytrium salamandrivorans]|uniref:Tail specific protease domain-containing protein n=1 Tax=Batrachochytrium salamandrivorans TaxID=1357716 RepID=A0ABQ8ES91_9FUNG|nr:hypothetical protein BASA50_001007 [Batrachochytrium salamandrivorans]